MQANTLLCRRPFESVEVTSGGDVRVCCWAEEFFIGNVAKQDISTIWNSPEAISFRESMYDGSFRYCDKNRCPYLNGINSRHSWVLVDTNGKSLAELSRFLPWDVAVAIKGQDRILDYNPKSTTLSYDSTCNLSCPSCRKQINNENFRKTEFNTFFEKLSPYGEHLIFSGSGDPFASAHFREVLFNSKENDLKLVQRITMITNGVLLTEKLWGKVSTEIKKKNIELSVSVDAANEETYRINRRGGNWQKLLENLDFIKRCADFKRLEMSFVIQENNFRQMKDFVKFSNNYDVDKIIFRKLSNWGTYTPKQYSEINLFSNTHPNHIEFLEILNDPIFKHPNIEMPPPDLESHQPISAGLPGLGYGFLSQSVRQNFIGMNESTHLYNFNGTVFQTDYLEYSKGSYSRKVISNSNEFMGFGYCHDFTFDLSSYERVILILKASDPKFENLCLLLTDTNGEFRVNLKTFGFKSDGNFHEIQIPLSEFAKGGIDLTKVKYSFAILATEVRVGDFFFINDLYME